MISVSWTHAYLRMISAREEWTPTGRQEPAGAPGRQKTETDRKVFFRLHSFQKQ